MKGELFLIGVISFLIGFAIFWSIVVNVYSKVLRTLIIIGILLYGIFLTLIISAIASTGSYFDDDSGAVILIVGIIAILASILPSLVTLKLHSDVDKLKKIIYKLGMQNDETTRILKQELNEEQVVEECHFCKEESLKINRICEHCGKAK